MAKNSPNKRKSVGESNDTPKKVKLDSALQKTPKNTPAPGSNKKTPQFKKANAGGNKTPQQTGKNNTPKSGKKQHEATPFPNNKNASPQKGKAATPAGGNKNKLNKFAGTAKLQQKNTPKNNANKTPDSPDESDDYEVEDNIKPGIISKKINDVEMSDDDEEDASDEEDDDVSDEEDDDDDDDDNDEDDDEDEGNSPKTKSKPDVKKVKPDGKKDQAKFVLFLGNLPYNATQQELKEHFSKTCEVGGVRLLRDQQTNKPRGFGFITLLNEASYIKALEKNRTDFNGRLINVQYTEGGNSKSAAVKKRVKKKNLKLTALMKSGKIGNKKDSQKRSVRRAKKRAIDSAAK